jgi:N-acetylglucosamine-6-phosphate deacetylase
VRFSDATLDEAVRMASTHPAALLGLAEEYGALTAGRVADLVLFRWNAESCVLAVAATLVRGEVVYRNESLLN